jgi:predicted short-subunit dehydrogenase-like oxidoreductase (DUF2520 family)
MPRVRIQTEKPTISLIGLGRMGQALAIALDAAGYPLQALVGRSNKDAGDDFAQLPPSDLFLITTPDDSIAEVALRLAAAKQGRARQTVLHTSGALSSVVLQPLAEAGWHTGSLHPLVSVSEPRAGAKALQGAFYCVEGDRTALRVARSLVKSLRGKSFSLKPESKALYHAAAVMASPHLVALFDLALGLLVRSGVDRQTAREIFLPLVASTVNNLAVFSSEQALTGTFARGDLATVKRHLEALSAPELAAAREVYKLLGLQSVQLAAKNGLDPQLLEQIKQLLLDARRA